MKKGILFLAVLLTTIATVSGQDSWRYYSNDNVINDLKVIDDELWIGTPSSLYIYNLESKKSRYLQSWNSDLRGGNIEEIYATTDYVYISLEQGGIARYERNRIPFGQGKWDQYYAPMEGDLDTIHRSRNLHLDGQNNLWFDFAWDGRTNFYSMNEELVRKENELLEEARKPSVGNSNDLYFVKNDTIFQYDQYQTLRAIPHAPDKFVQSNILKLFDYQNELVIIGVSPVENQVVIYKYNGDWELLATIEESLRNIIGVIGQSELWFNIYTENFSIEFMSYDGNEVQRYKLEDLTNEPIPTNGTALVYQDGDRLWFTSRDEDEHGNVVFSIVDGEVESYSTHVSELNYGSSYTTGNFDCEDNLVISGITSFEIFNPDSSKLIQVIEDRLDGDLIDSDIHPIDCTTYIMQADMFSGPSNIYIYDYDMLIDSIHIPDIALANIFFGSDGTLYAGSFGKGFGTYDGESWVWQSDPFYDSVFNRVNSVQNGLEAPNGDLLVHSYNELVIFSDGGWEKFDESNSPLSRTIFTVRADREGNVYVVQGDKFYKYDGIDWQLINIPTEGIYFISDIWQDEVDNFWIATYKHGLWYWNGADFTQYHIMNSAIPSNIIQSIKRKSDGELWLQTDYGWTTLNRDEIDFKKGLFGKTFYDANQNGVYEVNLDTGLKGQKVHLEGAGITSITDVNGNYSFYLDDLGEQTVSIIADTEYENTSSVSLVANFEDLDVFDLNFGLWKDTGIADLEIDFTAGPLICSSEVPIWLTLSNPGLITADGTLTMNLEPSLTYENSYPTAVAESDTRFTWNFNSLSFQETRTFYFVLKGPLVDDILAHFGKIEDIMIPFNIELVYSDVIQVIDTEETFLCAYDPNDKQGESVGESVGPYSLLVDGLDYTIRFQNEGNYKATNITIKDTLDDHLDWDSFELVSSSHLVTTQINEGNIITFRFRDIDLPPQDESEAGSQGFVKYRIKPKQGLADYSVIRNTAYIYFDLNSPIVTNTTINVLVEELPSPTSSDDFSLYQPNYHVYPNPNNGSFRVKSKTDKVFDIMVYDLEGKKVLTANNATEASHVSLPSSGMYLVKVVSDTYSEVIKVVVE